MTHEMDKEKMIDELEKMLIGINDDMDFDSTYMYHLAYDDNNNEWAIVFGWVNDNYYEDEVDQNWVVGKVAYQPVNSLMKEYDIDWLMPNIKDTDEVWDTEITVEDRGDLKWLVNEWEAIKKAFIDNE